MCISCQEPTGIMESFYEIIQVFSKSMQVICRNIQKWKGLKRSARVLRSTFSAISQDRMSARVLRSTLLQALCVLDRLPARVLRKSPAGVYASVSLTENIQESARSADALEEFTGIL